MILLGLLIIAIGAFCQSSCYVPINKIKSWSWESYWIVQGVFAWLVLPLLGALLAVPAGRSLCELFSEAPSFNLWMTVLFGALWGVGGLTFGLSMRYLGVALGQSIALGTCAGLGTVMGPVLLNIFFPENDPLSQLTFSVILGVVVTLVGIAIIGVAGSMKASSLSEEEKRAAVKDFNFPKGITIALLAGFMSGCFNVGLEFGSGINFGELTNPMFRTLPATLLVSCVGQQYVLLFPRRSLMVQPVLRTCSRKGFPYRLAHTHDTLILHTYGTQCGVLQCVGNHPERVERMLIKDYHGAPYWYRGAHSVMFPSAINITLRSINR